MKSSSIIAKLIRKKIEGRLRDDEQLLLEQWIAEEAHHPDLVHEITEKELETEDILIFLDLQKDHDVFLDRMTERTFSKMRNRPEQLTKQRVIPLRKLAWIAASLLLIIGVGTTYFTWRNTETETMALADLNPGSYQASVRLSNGEVVPLSQDQQMVKIGDALAYGDGSPVATRGHQDVGLVDVETPKGGTYQMELADGTKLWLNAASKVRVPTRFTDETREIFLEGEAYLEVAPVQKAGQRVPFIVQTPEQEIEVLGTHFNVSAYREDPAVTTTLVEGAVQVHAGGSNLLLAPGEQASLIDSKLDKKQVDVSTSISWVKNKFVFEETPIDQAMTTLGRWYDFQVEFEDGPPEVYFYGTINRAMTLMEVLSIMETSAIDFKLIRQQDQNKLIVME